jgi:hypothetical protein
MSVLDVVLIIVIIVIGLLIGGMIEGAVNHRVRIRKIGLADETKYVLEEYQIFGWFAIPIKMTTNYMFDTAEEAEKAYIAMRLAEDPDRVVGKITKAYGKGKVIKTIKL